MLLFVSDMPDTGNGNFLEPRTVQWTQLVEASDKFEVCIIVLNQTITQHKLIKSENYTSGVVGKWKEKYQGEKTKCDT